MNNIPPEIFSKILSKINIGSTIKYVPFGDGEQCYSIFHKKIYPYNFVNRQWYLFYK